MWVSTRSWHSRSRDASDRPPRALPSRRLCREKADSTCHRWPNTRRCREALGFFRNRLTICRRYVVLGHFRPCPRGLMGMTVALTPRSSRAYRWCSSASNAASARTRSQVTTSDAWAMTRGNWGESLDGPVVAVAPAMKWVRVSTATVSLVHGRDECFRPARLKKYRDVCRLSRPVPSTAAVGFSPIRPRRVADVVARWRRTTASPFLAAGRPRSTASSSGAPCPARGRGGGRPGR